VSPSGTLTVADLLREESLKLRLVAGASGTAAEVKGVHISEIPDPTPWLSPGDVLLTTGLSVRAELHLQVELVRRLAGAGVVALGVAEGIYLQCTPPEVRAEADGRGLPLFEVPLDIPFKAITSLVFNSLHSASFYQLRRSLSVQDRLLALLLEDRGLDHLVSSVAMLLSSSVIVFDSLGQAVSQAHARTRVTPHLRELVWNVYLSEGCRRQPGLCGLEIGPHQVFIEEICLGGRAEQILVFIYPRGEGVTEMARVIMEYARKILSLELHRSREEVLVQTRMRGGLLDDILSGLGSQDSLSERLANFRFARGGALVLVVCDLDRFTARLEGDRGFEAEERLQLLKTHHKESVDSFFSAQRLPFLSLAKSDSILVLLQPPSAAASDLRTLGQELRAHVAENPPHLSTTIGVSDAFEDVSVGPRAFSQAREAVEGGRLQEGAPVVLFSDLGPRLRALENHSPEWLDSLARQAFGALLDREDERDHLLESLQAYLESNRSVAKAAQLLYVHPNTLRNRLRKVEELVGRSLEDTATLVDLSLGFEALRILSRLRAAGPPASSTFLPGH
jgi:PucR family transcriptional regulator, purine catabolism regulatory protein